MRSRPSVDFSICASYYTREIIYLCMGTDDDIMTELAIKTEGSIEITARCIMYTYTRVLYNNRVTCAKFNYHIKRTAAPCDLCYTHEACSKNNERF